MVFIKVCNTLRTVRPGQAEWADLPHGGLDLGRQSGLDFDDF